MWEEKKNDEEKRWLISFIHCSSSITTAANTHQRRKKKTFGSQKSHLFSHPTFSLPKHRRISLSPFIYPSHAILLFNSPFLILSCFSLTLSSSIKVTHQVLLLLERKRVSFSLSDSFFCSHNTPLLFFSLVWLHSLRWELVALNSLSAGGLPTSNQTSMICLIMVTFLSYFTWNTLKQKQEGIFNLNANFISAFDLWVQMMMGRGMRRILGEGSVSTVWISWELPPQDSHQTTLSRNTVRRLQMLSTKGCLRMIGWLLWSASISLLGLILDNS